MSNSCEGCGKCCQLFYINLSKKEFESGQYLTMDQDSSLHLLAKAADGSCIYLVNNHCSIHLTRPAVCRQFFCTSKNKKFQEMIKIIALS